MRRFVDSLACSCRVLAMVAPFVPLPAAVALLAAVALPAAASGPLDSKDWIASAAITSAVTFQDWEADAESLVCRDCVLPGQAALAEPLRPPVDGDDRDVTPFIGGQLELMTPELPVPGSPRVFLAGEVLGAFGTERKVAQDGEPGAIGSPAPASVQDRAPFGDDNATGQGSEVVGTMQDVAYGAYLGLSFPLEVFGRSLRLKPAIAWIRYEIEVEGLVSDADCLPLANRTECNPNVDPPLPPGFLRETQLPASNTEAFDGLGPSLDIELDTGRAGPVNTSLFLGARVYRMIGDQDVELRSGPVAFDDVLGQDTAAARYRFEVDDWMYRIGIGVRFSWIGFDR